MSSKFNNLYEFEGLRLDPQTRTLWRGEELISIPPKAFDLLKLLLERRGSIVPKQEIFETVWAGTFVEDGVLTQNIYTLRQALGTRRGGKQLIENVARRGYRLNIPPAVSFQAPEAAETLPGPSPEPLGAPVPRKRAMIYILLLTLILLIPAGTYVAYRAIQNSRAAGEPGEKMRFQRLTDTGDASYLTISPAGALAAYTRGSGVFIKNLETNAETKVNIESEAVPAGLQFSPDGEFIYFGTVRNPDQRGAIFRVSRAGGVPEMTAENVWSGFSISPDGAEVAYVRKFPNESRDELLIRDLSSGAERILKELKAPEAFYWNGYPAWSADGKKIAAAVISPTEHFIRLLVLGASGGNETEVHADDLRNVEQVVWNADGSAVIAAANDGENFQIWRISVADGSRKRITNDLNSYLGVAISADRTKLVARQRIYFSNIWVGQKDDLPALKQITSGTSRNDGLKGLSWISDDRLVYTSNDEKIRDWNLWIVNSADGARQKITSNTETQNDYPVVSPDKKSIYFASETNKESRIWRVNLDGSNPEQVTFGESESHSFPQISPDGAWLYFVIKNAKFSTIGRKSLLSNSVQELSGARNYVPGNFLTISPDGKYLAFANLASEARAEHSDSPLEVGIVSTEDPQRLSFHKIPAWLQRAEWGRNGKFLDFVTGDVRANGISRYEIATGRISEILPKTDGSIFDFAWSPTGSYIAVSRGQLSRDVVLITDFE
jgi:Tol biopolymer transport system component/DNA-binding winged helix-turn-helix (wHTH) protein